jgi:glycosyltransferase involved in cell wall biosynthesis
MRIGILHYSVPPVVGGVEAVIQAHASLLLQAGFSVELIAGAGAQSACPAGAEFIHIPQLDSRHSKVVDISQHLEAGVVPADLDRFSRSIEKALAPYLVTIDTLMVHNIFTKHFNLPLTIALVHLLEAGKIKRCIAWCHDFTWTSPHSRPFVHPGYPWDLLRTYRTDVTYVTVSQHRQQELAGLFGCPVDRIRVIYDGVDPADIYSLSGKGKELVDRLTLLEDDLFLLMPVRITQAKNIEFALRVVHSLKSTGMRVKLVVTGPPDPHDPADMEYYHSLLELRAMLQLEKEARFVYESGPSSGEGYIIDLPLVRELYRVCDALFMPSHREGFGMPILEAGMIGMPIFTTAIPAAQEIGMSEVMRFSLSDGAEQVAGMISQWAKSDPQHIFRQRVRQNLTWRSIFQHDILTLLSGDSLP